MVEALLEKNLGLYNLDNYLKNSRDESVILLGKVFEVQVKRIIKPLYTPDYRPADEDFERLTYITVDKKNEDFEELLRKTYFEGFDIVFYYEEPFVEDPTHNTSILWSQITDDFPRYRDTLFGITELRNSDKDNKFIIIKADYPSKIFEKELQDRYPLHQFDIEYLIEEEVKYRGKNQGFNIISVYRYFKNYLFVQDLYGFKKSHNKFNMFDGLYILMEEYNQGFVDEIQDFIGSDKLLVVKDSAIIKAETILKRYQVEFDTIKTIYNIEGEGLPKKIIIPVYLEKPLLACENSMQNQLQDFSIEFVYLAAK